MKITKLVHSCLLVEMDGKTALFDPGSFSKEAGLAKLDEVGSLDYLLITHNHADHLDEDFVAEIIKRWPDVKLAANQQVQDQLVRHKLEPSGQNCVMFEAQHEQLPTGGQVPDNNGWHFGGLSHPGDSLSFVETNEVLALPYVAPWGSTTEAVELAKKLKPKYVIPIHDWHLSDQARQWYKGLLEQSLGSAQVEVIDAANGGVEI